jgi:hypothetical protein
MVVIFNQPVTEGARLILKNDAGGDNNAPGAPSEKTFLPENFPEGVKANNILIFHATGLKSGTTYGVTLAGVKSQRGGNNLSEADSKWSYTSAEGPVFSRYWISDKTESGLFPLRPKIRVEFNRPVISGEYELARVLNGKASSPPVAKGRMSLEPNESSSKYLFVDTSHYGKLEPETRYELKVHDVSDKAGNILEAVVDPCPFTTVPEKRVSFQEMINKRQEMNKKPAIDPGTISEYTGKLIRWTGTVIEIRPAGTTILLGDQCDVCLNDSSKKYRHSATFLWYDGRTFPGGLKEGASICLEGVLWLIDENVPLDVRSAGWSSCP